jgi:hypothetical protein
MRISAAEPSMQSRRVSITMSRIVAMPRPSSPTRVARAPWNSTSEEALDQSPSLSFKRISVNGVLRTVGQATRQQEAGQTARRLREHEEAVGHRRGEEPLVARQRVVVATEGFGAGRVRAHVRAALLLRHAHAEGDAALVGDLHLARIVVRRRRLLGPFRPTPVRDAMRAPPHGSSSTDNSSRAPPGDAGNSAPRARHARRARVRATTGRRRHVRSPRCMSAW